MGDNPLFHPGILQYQPVARSLHDLDQEFKASSTFTRSEVIPIPNDRSSGRALSDNTIGSSLINPDTQASYTSRDALSVPLHVGFQVEDPSPSALPAAPVGNLRMNPKGRVLSLEGDLNGASSQYRRRAVVARQPYAEGRQLVLQNPQAQQTSDMSLSETSYMPSLVYGQKGEALVLLILCFKVSTVNYYFTKKVLSLNFDPSKN